MMPVLDLIMVKHISPQLTTEVARVSTGSVIPGTDRTNDLSPQLYLPT